MNYKQKYLKYKQKYIALKEQSSFVQGGSIQQKYIALKYLDLIGGGKTNYGLNILGKPIKPCPVLNGKNTGFYRNNYCKSLVQMILVHM